jgi:cytochrome c553
MRGSPPSHTTPPDPPADRRLGRLARHYGIVAGVMVVAGAIVGFLVALSGIVPLKASSGHWRITQWFLNFSMERSVTTHSLGVRSPPLDDRASVLRGAGHYDFGCRPCHGSPTRPPPLIAQHMTPHPPDLMAMIPQWDPEELFYIVKHGVKFTGMPAWAAQTRDDEVWAMVAFLLEMPRLDASGYDRLVHGEPLPDGFRAEVQLPAAGASHVIQFCARCHGVDGHGREGGDFPRLGGQKPLYLQNALNAYRDGKRHSGTMGPIAGALAPGIIEEVVRHYSGLQPARPHPPVESAAESAARGESIAARGIPAQKVPSCTDCHGPAASPANPAYPFLAGQPAEYLALQLRLFREQRRGGSEYARIMLRVAAKLTDSEIEDVAAYYSSLELE